MDENNLVTEEEAIGSLYLCDCPDDSNHTDPFAHQVYCDYRFWYLTEEYKRKIDQLK